MNIGTHPRSMPAAGQNPGHYAVQNFQVGHVENLPDSFLLELSVKEYHRQYCQEPFALLVNALMAILY